MSARSQLGENDKEVVKNLSGNHYGVEWEIVCILNAEGKYYCRVSAIPDVGSKYHANTSFADDVDTAISFGGACLVEAFDLLGVPHAS